MRNELNSRIRYAVFIEPQFNRLYGVRRRLFQRRNGNRVRARDSSGWWASGWRGKVSDRPTESEKEARLSETPLHDRSKSKRQHRHALEVRGLKSTGDLNEAASERLNEAASERLD